eukprot:Hpha_TRINITY_DN15868_c2_g2::TRINITY_DN15868_c2_g2_i1::g.192112::m.192112
MYEQELTALVFMLLGFVGILSVVGYLHCSRRKLLSEKQRRINDLLEADDNADDDELIKAREVPPTPPPPPPVEFVYRARSAVSPSSHTWRAASEKGWARKATLEAADGVLQLRARMGEGALRRAYQRWVLFVLGRRLRERLSGDPRRRRFADGLSSPGLRPQNRGGGAVRRGEVLLSPSDEVRLLRGEVHELATELLTSLEASPNILSPRPLLG